MDASARIAGAIVLAAVVVAGSYIGYREYDRSRNIREVRESIHAFNAQLDAESQAERQDYLHRKIAANGRRRYAAQIDLRRRRLTDSQQCLDNVVVEIHGATYSQPLYRGVPVRCHGRMADSAMR